MPVLIAPPDPPVGKALGNPRIRVHHVPPIHDRRVGTPAQPPHLGRHEPPVLLVPGKDRHRAREHPFKIPEEPRLGDAGPGSPGVVCRDLRATRNLHFVEPLLRCALHAIEVVDEYDESIWQLTVPWFRS